MATSPPTRPASRSFADRRLGRLATAPAAPASSAPGLSALGPIRVSGDGPADFIALGLVLGPLGLQGDLRVRLLSPDATAASALDAFGQRPSDEEGNHPSVGVGEQASKVWVRLGRGLPPQAKVPDCGWIQAEILRVSGHGGDRRIRMIGLESRDQAEWLTRAEIGLPRAELPEPDEDEHYWADLLGLNVINEQGVSLGSVDRLDTNGAHDWLISGPHWIPFVDAYVLEVDLTARRILVDWQADWS